MAGKGMSTLCISHITFSFMSFPFVPLLSLLLVSEIEGDDGNGWSFLSHFSSLYLSSLLSLSLTILLFPFPLSFATSEQDERERGK